MQPAAARLPPTRRLTAAARRAEATNPALRHPFIRHYTARLTRLVSKLEESAAAVLVSFTRRAKDASTPTTEYLPRPLRPLPELIRPLGSGNIFCLFT